MFWQIIKLRGVRENGLGEICAVCETANDWQCHSDRIKESSLPIEDCWDIDDEDVSIHENYVTAVAPVERKHFLTLNSFYWKEEKRKEKKAEENLTK